MATIDKYGLKKTFTRKGNADRHNLTIHDEIAIVYNKETGKKSDKRKTNHYSSFSPTLTITAKTKADAFTNTRQISYPFDNNPEEFDSSKTHSEINKNIHEEFQTTYFFNLTVPNINIVILIIK